MEEIDLPYIRAFRLLPALAQKHVSFSQTACIGSVMWFKRKRWTKYSCTLPYRIKGNWALKVNIINQYNNQRHVCIGTYLNYNGFRIMKLVTWCEKSLLHCTRPKSFYNSYLNRIYSILLTTSHLTLTLCEKRSTQFLLELVHRSQLQLLEIRQLFFFFHARRLIKMKRE